MDEKQAREIAGRYVDGLQRDAGVELAINDEATERRAQGHVFFYNTAEYWRTRDMMTGLAGNGPLLVREDGEVVALPTNKSLAQGLAEI